MRHFQSHYGWHRSVPNSTSLLPAQIQCLILLKRLQFLLGLSCSYTLDNSSLNAGLLALDILKDMVHNTIIIRKGKPLHSGLPFLMINKQGGMLIDLDECCGDVGMDESGTNAEKLP